MKLLFCPDCGDMTQMVSTYRRCKCGSVKGRYVNDAVVEVFGDLAQVISIPGEDIRAALDAVKADIGGPVNVRAWMHPRVSSSVLRMGRERTPR
jgi:hypothetical protein